MEPMAGIEPATDGLRNRCSTTELHWQKNQLTTDNELARKWVKSIWQKLIIAFPADAILEQPRFQASKFYVSLKSMFETAIKMPVSIAF